MPTYYTTDFQHPTEKIAVCDAPNSVEAWKILSKVIPNPRPAFHIWPLKEGQVLFGTPPADLIREIVP